MKKENRNLNSGSCSENELLLPRNLFSWFAEKIRKITEIRNLKQSIVKIRLQIHKTHHNFPYRDQYGRCGSRLTFQAGTQSAGRTSTCSSRTATRRGEYLSVSNDSALTSDRQIAHLNLNLNWKGLRNIAFSSHVAEIDKQMQRYLST